MARLRARYMTKYLGEQPVTYTKASMDPETKSLQQELVTEKRKCWMILFPQGHSIRVTDRKELERMGYHLKPRIVDMETGDVMQAGGDVYNFDDMDNELQPDILDDTIEVEEEAPAKSRSNK